MHQMKGLHGHVGTLPPNVNMTGTAYVDVRAGGEESYTQTPDHTSPRHVNIATTSDSNSPIDMGANTNTANNARDIISSTVDRGANGGIEGCGMCLLSHAFPESTIDIEGVGNHVISKLKIGTHGAVVCKNHGEAILIFHQYASHSQGQSIHSSLQLENNSITVNDI